MTTSIAAGIAVGVDWDVTGTLVRVEGPEQVLALLDSGVAGDILLVDAASATGIAPILPEAAGVVCTSGGATSHLALVCKEFGVPCLMSTSFDEDPTLLLGTTVALRADGHLHRAG